MGVVTVQRVFERYFQIHQRPSLGHLRSNYKVHMALKLGGYNHHLEGNFYRYFLGHLRSSRGHLRSYQWKSSYGFFGRYSHHFEGKFLKSLSGVILV